MKDNLIFIGMPAVGKSTVEQIRALKEIEEVSEIS